MRMPMDPSNWNVGLTSAVDHVYRYPGTRNIGVGAPRSDR